MELGRRLTSQLLLVPVFRAPSLCDLESLDAEFHKSLLWIKEAADSSELSALDLTFSVDEEVCSQSSCFASLCLIF